MARPRIYPRKNINTGKVKKVCIGKSFPRKKPCRICGKVKYLSSYYFLKTAKCFTSYCKPCHSNYMADRYQSLNG